MNEEVEGVDSDCIFCSIASKRTEADIAHESKNAIFFHDISPKAAVHIVGIPKKHIVSLAGIGEEDRELVSEMIFEVARAARKLGLNEEGYRVITNVGNNAGQEVKHLHWHILGGERLGALN